MEPVGVTGGAQAADEYLRCRHAGTLELVGVGAPDVENQRPCPANEPSLAVHLAPAPGVERLHQLLPHFVATRTDTRADRHRQRVGQGLTSLGERANGRSRHVGGSTAPPGMRGRDDATGSVSGQNRRAICDLNRDDAIGGVGYDDVRFGSAAGARSRDMNGIAMHLRETDDLVGRQTNGLADGRPAGPPGVGSAAQLQLPGGPAVPNGSECAALQGQTPRRLHPRKLSTHLRRHVRRIVKYPA